ncbi:penicillin-binding protein [Thalassobacillus hwangdonensis]|uniref:serine-type D-Ala-D-Ala carboxypeptidase n=1 Tax=Thalassobacillus hwangdonensis TaxID=546108 RepID=A0ABW3KW15_9BACI
MAKIWGMLFAALFLLLLGRFLYIESSGVVQGVDLNEWADTKRTSAYSIDADRGRILDQNGMILAYDRPTFKLQAIVDEEYSKNLEEPKHVTDPEKTAELLAPLLNMEEASIRERIEEGISNGRFQVEFGNSGKNLTQEKRDAIADLKLPGITFAQESKRYYPNGTFASHVIGFARNEGEKIVGVTGMEKQMAKYLEGEPGQISYKRDKYGIKLLDPEEIITEPDHGENVVLTIDQKIQTFLEDAMTQVDEQYKPEKIMAAVMDPKTGEVLALGNRPSYNPNDIGNVQNWYNDVISYPFEPGSTMKMFTWAAAMEEGVYNPSEAFKSGRYEYIDGKYISDHNGGEGWGSISFDQGFRFSSNVAAAKLAIDKLGPERFLQYLNKFGFNRETGVDLPGELKGRILYEWQSEKVTTSFGQGTTTTPIQLLTAASAIANGGKMMKPYVLSEVVDSESGAKLKESKPEVIDTPISEKTAKQMRELLGTVITGEGATGNHYKLNDYTLGGKTGTAQIPNTEGGGYMTGKDNYIFSFMGMAPVEDPELLIYVAVKQPKLAGNEYGAEPVAHIVKTVMENSLHYLNIRPDKTKDHDVKAIEVPELEGSSVSKAKSQLTKDFEKVTVIGDGTRVASIYPDEGTKVLPGRRIILVTDKPAIPDLTGWSTREVQGLADVLDLKLDVLGSGYAFKQSVKEGANVKKGDYLAVEFKHPSSTEEEVESDQDDPETEQTESEEAQQEDSSEEPS